TLSDFDKTLSSQWNGTKTPVVFAAELDAASGAVGPGLLAPSHMNVVRMELDHLKTLGVGAVTVAISWPLLYQPYFDYEHANEPGSSVQNYNAQDFIDVYKQVAAEAHSRGIKLIVESGPIFPSYSALSVNNYY